MTTSSRRRYPRYHLDVDWFVESSRCSAMGRSVEVSIRSALLPVTCTSPFTQEVTLYVSLPERQKMFKAKCSAVMRDRGWVLDFRDVSLEDLRLLGTSLIAEYGLGALPALERRFGRSAELPAHLLR